MFWLLQIRRFLPAFTTDQTEINDPSFLMKSAPSMNSCLCSLFYFIFNAFVSLKTYSNRNGHSKCESFKRGSKNETNK